LLKNVGGSFSTEIQFYSLTKAVLELLSRANQKQMLMKFISASEKTALHKFFPHSISRC
jgi:hypothetical protein